jgi:hypothetical protein
LTSASDTINTLPQDEKQREISRYMQALALDGLEAYSMALFTRTLGWSLAETQLLLMGARKDLREYLP